MSEAEENYLWFPMPCSLDYSGLVRSGYTLEGFTTEDTMGIPRLAQDGCIITFYYCKPHYWGHGPKLFFFRNAARSKLIWVAFAEHRSAIFLPERERKLWAVIGGSVNGMEDAKLISKDCPLEPNNGRWDKGLFLEHSLISKLSNGETVVLVVTKAIVDNRVGNRAMIAVLQSGSSDSSDSQMYSDLEEPEAHNVPLRDIVSGSELGDDGSFGKLIEVNQNT